MSGEVLQSESVPGVKGGTMLFQRETVVTKGRTYAYWYAYQRTDHRLFKVYVGQGVGGRLTPSVIAKAKRAMAEKMRAFDPC